MIDTEMLVEPDTGCSVPSVFCCFRLSVIGLVYALLVVASTDFSVTEIT